MLRLKPLAKTFEYAYIKHMSNLATRLAGFAAAAFLAAAVLTANAGARAAELVMFERPGCPWCARWDAEVAPAYVKSPEGARAPLRRHNLDNGQPRDITLERPVRYTPTFVLAEGGREVARITGYIDNGMFWGLLAPMIASLDANRGDADALETKE